MKLNLGCGMDLLEGYLNVDSKSLTPEQIANKQFRCADCRNLHWIPNNSVEEILARKVIEHIHPLDIPETLYEWSRVLDSDGSLVLIYPDFDRLVSMYLRYRHLETTREFFAYLRICYEVLNATKSDLAKADPHRSLITEKFLQIVLSNEGYKIESCEPYGSEAEREYTVKLTAKKVRLE